MPIVASPDDPGGDRAVERFTFHSNEIRTVRIDAEPWWIARDVCTVLEIRNVADAMSSLDEDEKGVATTDTPGGAQQMAIINEPGLYSLILRSRKPQAKAFKRWITHEVIPAIRKTGRYDVSQNQPNTIAMTPDEERRALAARRDLSVIEAMGGIVDPQWRESLARHTWAVYKGEASDIAAEDRLLMVQPYLVERGVSKADIASIGSVFGKRVKAAYVAEYNREPEEVPALLNGRERPLKGYYERDRFLFDAVFDERYSHLVGPMQLELGAA